MSVKPAAPRRVPDGWVPGAAVLTADVPIARMPEPEHGAEVAAF